MEEEDNIAMQTNDQLMLIVGYSSTGKSASLRNIKNQEKWIYFNTESNKKLPFKNKFINVSITNPTDLFSYFQEAIDNPDDVEGIIIDSLTFLMDLYESKYVLTAANTMKAWSDFAQFFKKLMQDYVAKFNKPVIFTAHVKDEVDENTLTMKTFIPVKGSLKGNGLEAYFSVIVSTKVLPLKDLKDYKNPMLTITEDDEITGVKNVFQTRITKKTTGERIRGPMGLFSISETFIDNDAQLLLDKLRDYYEIEA